MSVFKKNIKKVMIFIFICILLTFAVDIFVVLSSRSRVYTEDYGSFEGYEHILVLGASIWGDSPSHILRDRLIKAAEVYENTDAGKVIMSGDHELSSYDEVTLMCSYGEGLGIAGEDIIPDDYGLSTYDSMYRAKNEFGVTKLIIVTQRYHMYRAV